MATKRGTGKKPATPRVPRGLSRAEAQVMITEALEKAGVAHVGRVAEEVASKAVQSTLLTLGVDISDPIKAQTTFAALRQMVATFADPEFQRDLAHIRDIRQTVSEVKRTGFRHLAGAAATLLITAVGLYLWPKIGGK